MLVLFVLLTSCLAATGLGWTLSYSASAAGNTEALAPTQGNPVWTPFNLSDDPVRSQQYAEAAANSANGSFFVVWKVIPADETPPTSSGLPEFQSAATGVYTTPWTAIAPGETLSFTHTLGGDPDQYAVELWFLDDENGGAGMHRRGYGGDFDGGQLAGVYWWDLTGSGIRVTRGPGDTQADQVRLRIWQADPPDWDSGWMPIQPGDANTKNLAHNLGGNADDYLVALKFRDSRAQGLGIHHYAYGGLDLAGQVQGAAWHHLTNAAVQVVRFGGDQTVGEVRLLIYRPDPADPPAYDSGWQELSVGQRTTFTHSLGGNPASYLVRVATRSTLQGINSFGAGGIRLNSGQQRGAYIEQLTGASVGLYRQAQDIYSQQARLRIWLPTRPLYLPLVTNGS